MPEVPLQAGDAVEILAATASPPGQPAALGSYGTVVAVDQATRREAVRLYGRRYPIQVPLRLLHRLSRQREHGHADLSHLRTRRPTRGLPPGGRCRMCEMYWRRHGVERPPGAPRPLATLRPCTNCGQATLRPARGRCKLCYEYWHRHDVERPLGPRPLQPCQVCARPVPALRRGRCNTCYDYWYRTGRERPPERWQHG